MDVELSFTALEFVLTLLASQSLLALKDAKLSQREKQLIKRELSTELSVFHELVKKRIWDGVRDEPLHRKRYGIQMATLNYSKSDEESDKHTPTTSQYLANTISSSDRMRVNLTRKLHLESQQSPSPSKSPFNSGQQFHSSTSSQQQQQQKFVLPQTEPTVSHESSIDSPVFSELSFIRLVEEDYLHFLSNLFSYICHTEKIN